ncbi:hypothetical protein MMC12_006206 [Toensbergia leucococca]|nr:hypothetical protein [Toensbergia leucococca]
MPLELRQVISANEVPEIVEGWMKNAVQLTQTLESVNWGTDESSHKDRVEDLCARQWFRYSTTPGSVWLKVVDTDLGDKVVAASRWTIRTRIASSEAILPARAYWLPPGPVRRFYEVIREDWSAVWNRQKPHVRKSIARFEWTETDLDTPDLLTTYTLIEHRRRGANTLMMEWGTRKADELGLETWLEATPLGSMAYARHGFGFLHTVELHPSAELREDNDEWRHWEEATKDLRLAVMRRLVNGVCNDDKVDAASFPAHDLVRNIWLK